MENREIKFRGQIIHSREWIYGWLSSPDTIAIKSGDDYDDIPIIPETVGQFTGLKDKNGQDIYKDEFVESKHGDIFLVDFRKGSWVLIHKPSCGSEREGTTECKWDYLYDAIILQLEIIGNIHENPNLL